MAAAGIDVHRRPIRPSDLRHDAGRVPEEPLPQLQSSSDRIRRFEQEETLPADIDVESAVPVPQNGQPSRSIGVRLGQRQNTHSIGLLASEVVFLIEFFLNYVFTCCPFIPCVNSITIHVYSMF